MDKLESDWLDCKVRRDRVNRILAAEVAAAEVAAAVAVVQTPLQRCLEKTADQADHSTTGCRLLVRIVRQCSKLGTNYQSDLLQRKVYKTNQREHYLILLI